MALEGPVESGEQMGNKKREERIKLDTWRETGVCLPRYKIFTIKYLKQLSALLKLRGYFLQILIREKRTDTVFSA